jgi:hypothetical protein
MTWRTSGDELHFLGSVLLLHGETRETRDEIATARRQIVLNRSTSAHFIAAIRSLK